MLAKPGGTSSRNALAASRSSVKSMPRNATSSPCSATASAKNGNSAPARRAPRRPLVDDDRVALELRQARLEVVRALAGERVRVGCVRAQRGRRLGEPRGGVALGGGARARAVGCAAGRSAAGGERRREQRRRRGWRAGGRASRDTQDGGSARAGRWVDVVPHASSYGRGGLRAQRRASRRPARAPPRTAPARERTNVALRWLSSRCTTTSPASARQTPCGQPIGTGSKTVDPRRAVGEAADDRVVGPARRGRRSTGKSHARRRLAGRRRGRRARAGAASAGSR